MEIFEHFYSWLDKRNEKINHKNSIYYSTSEFKE